MIRKLILTTLLVYLACVCQYTYCSNEHKRYIQTSYTDIGFTYTQTQLPSGYGPIGCTKMVVFKSQGIKVYYCEPTSPIGLSDMSICVTLKSRFGSRFCNNNYGQVILQAIVQYIKNTYLTTWTTNVTTTFATGYTKFVLTSTSSGPCIQINVPSANFSITMSALRKMIADIYTLADVTSISDSQVDALCSSISTEIISTASSLDNQTSLWNAMCRPKQDSAFTGTGYTTTPICYTVAGTEQYTSSRLTSLSGTNDGRMSCRLCLKLLSLERDITLFIVTLDQTVFPKIASEMQLINTSLSPNLVKAYNRNYYGFAGNKGGNFQFVRSSSPSNNAAGGIIFFGPISSESMLASAMSVKLLRDHTITSGSYQGYAGFHICPAAGQCTLRLCSHELFAATARANFGIFVAALKARYNAGANTADFSNTAFMTLISEVYNNFTIGTSHVAMSGDPTLSSMFTATCEAYVWCIQMFEGALHLFNELNTYKNGSTANQTALLQRAAAIIVACADTTQTCEYNYLLTATS